MSSEDINNRAEAPEADLVEEVSTCVPYGPEMNTLSLRPRMLIDIPKLDSVWKAIESAVGPTVIDLCGLSFGGPVNGLVMRREHGTRSFVTKYLLIDNPGIEIRNGSLDLGQHYRLKLQCPGQVTFTNVDIIGQAESQCQLEGVMPLVHVTGAATKAAFSGCSIRSTATNMGVTTLYLDGQATCVLSNCQVTHLTACGVKVAGGTLSATYSTFIGDNTSVLALPAPISASMHSQPPADGSIPSSSGRSRNSTINLVGCSLIANSEVGPVIQASGCNTQLSAAQCKLDGGSTGILVSKSAKVQMVATEVIRASHVGIWASNSFLSAAQCTLQKNKVGVMVERRGHVELLRSKFELNKTSSVIVRGEASVARLVDCVARNNELVQEDGGVILREDGIAHATAPSAGMPEDL